MITQNVNHGAGLALEQEEEETERLLPPPGEPTRRERPERPTDHAPPPDHVMYQQILDLLQGHRREVESLRVDLFGENGQLNRYAKRQADNLAALRDEMLTRFGTLIDDVNVVKMKLGIIESADSDSAIKAATPFRCLVVDDDAELRTLIRCVLEMANIETLEAENGDAAIAHLEAEAPIDVVLTDISMPRNGAGLVAHIRRSHPRVEVVIMTGFDGIAASRALEAGAHSYLTKPFHSNDALVLAVVRAAEHRRLRTRATSRNE